MSHLAILLMALGFGLAYVNGANDVSKGIATLVGSKLANYRQAILWGSAWTGLGGLVGAMVATAMITSFGKGLLVPGTTQTIEAAVAALVGATLWVLIATRTGLPVSTTHAIVGSLVGVATVAYGIDGLEWIVLVTKILLPLIITPLVSFGVVAWLLQRRKVAPGSAVSARPDCLCAELAVSPLAAATVNASSLSSFDQVNLQVTVNTQQACATEHPAAVRLTRDQLHWLTSGAVSFGRGLNDTPKIVALVLSTSALSSSTDVSSPWLFGMVTTGMLAGGITAGRRVTRVLAEDVTPMDQHEGFIANLVTAVMVTLGATLGMPMSTTHVSSGGIVGAGLQRGGINHSKLREIGLAWVVTLPAAALLGIVAYQIGRLTT